MLASFAKGQAANESQLATSEELGLIELFGEPSDEALQWTSAWLSQQPKWSVAQQDNKLLLNGFNITGEGDIAIPRLATSLISLSALLDGEPCQVDLTPEPDQWLIRWRGQVEEPQEPYHQIVIELTCKHRPVGIEQVKPIQPEADQRIFLEACFAKTAGKSVRYEPLPHKNTVGYWTDAEEKFGWQFVIEQPGQYAVAILNGCATDQAGSELQLTVSNKSLNQSLSYPVVGTGHFQNFRWNHVGLIDLSEAGEYQLVVTCSKRAKFAICDVREVQLVRQATAPKKE